jgi:MYXO-CTERM domain-containing protein
MTARNRFAFASAVAIAAVAVVARTAPASVITFDENGNGTIQLQSGQIVPLFPAGNIADPFDPGNGLFPLAYKLTASLGIPTVPVVGDVDVIEIPGATPPSDLLRWTTNGLLLVYSDRPEPGEINPPLADVGLPVLRQSNLINRLETGPEAGPNGLFGYTPTPNEPGFYTNTTLDTPIYNFISDGAVPEPASWGVAAVAGIALLRRRRRAPKVSTNS